MLMPLVGVSVRYSNHDDLIQLTSFVELAMTLFSPDSNNYLYTCMYGLNHLTPDLLYDKCNT